MPRHSARLEGISPPGHDDWAVHFAAMTRRQAGEKIIMLSVGDHDFDTPAETVDAAVRLVREGHHHYTQLPGLPGLRAAMARVSTRALGIETKPSEVIATLGGQGALYAALQATLDRGDHAILVAPYYATYPGTVRAAEADFTIVETDPEAGFVPEPAAIEAAVTPKTRVILINSPNNPTGAIYSRETLEGIAEICRRHDLWLLSDEVYWSFAGDRHVSPRALPGMAERTLVINSMSKSHGMTGWRIGWLTGPEAFITKLISLNLVSTYGLGDFVSRAAIEALEKDYGVARIAEIYRERRAVILEALRGMNGAIIRGSKGGMYVMLDISAVTHDAEAFAFDLLEAEKLAVLPGAAFGEASRSCIRISLCQPEPVLHDAVGRLRRFIGSYRRKVA